MPIYRAAPVSECGEIRLECWSIRQVATGEQYFVGFNVDKRDGRVSTPIVSFDARTRIGFTSSGRRYHLFGKAGFDGDAEYVWNKVVAVWNLEWKDVTPELCPDWRNPIPEAERVSTESAPQIESGRAEDESDRMDR